MASIADSQWPWREPIKQSVRGAFIVIEGLDRAGKTTQAKRLCDALYAKGHNVKTLRFPDRATPMGKMIDSYLQSKTDMDDHTIHLLFSANRWEKAKWITESLTAGYTIVCDRYYYSGMVYSTAKRNPSLSLSWARSPDVGLPKPDLVVFLDLDSEEAARRGGFGDEKYEKAEMQVMVRKLFLGLSKLEQYEGKDMVMINAGKSIEELGDEVLRVVVSKLQEVAKSTSKHGGLDAIPEWTDSALDSQPFLKYAHIREHEAYG